MIAFAINDVREKWRKNANKIYDRQNGIFVSQWNEIMACFSRFVCCDSEWMWTRLMMSQKSNIWKLIKMYFILRRRRFIRFRREWEARKRNKSWENYLVDAIATILIIIERIIEAIQRTVIKWAQNGIELKMIVLQTF